MNDTELIIKFAELEGIELFMHRGELYVACKYGNLYVNDRYLKKYNPITDSALNCDARDKYNVDICYHMGYMSSREVKGALENGYTEFTSKDDIKKCVIVCILKSRGAI